MKNKKRVLITGGEGFVGKHLINYLLKESDYSIFATFHLENNNRIENKRVEYKKINISDQGEVDNLIREVEPDYVYHLAGISFVPVSFEKPHLTYNTNFIGTLNLYESIRKYKTR